MSCKDDAEKQADALAPASRVAFGQGDVAERCWNLRCGRPLDREGNCPRGCRRYGLPTYVERPAVVPFAGTSVFDAYDFGGRKRLGGVEQPQPLEWEARQAEGLAELYQNLQRQSPQRDVLETLTNWISDRKGRELGTWTSDVARALDDLDTFYEDLQAAGQDWQRLYDAFHRLEDSAFFGGWSGLGAGAPEEVWLMAQAHQEERERNAVVYQVLLERQREIDGGADICPECGGSLTREAGEDEYGDEVRWLTCTGCASVYDEDEPRLVPGLDEEDRVTEVDVSDWLQAVSRAHDRLERLQDMLHTIECHDGTAEDGPDWVASELHSLGHDEYWGGFVDSRDPSLLLDEITEGVDEQVRELLEDDDLGLAAALAEQPELRQVAATAVLLTPGGLADWQRQTPLPASVRAADLGATGDDALWQGQIALAYELYREAARQGLATGSLATAAGGLWQMGRMAAHPGSPLQDTPLPLAYLEAAQEMWIEQGNRAGRAECDEEIARVYAARKQWSSAEGRFEQAIRAFQDTGLSDRAHQAEHAMGQAAYNVAAALGQADDRTRRAALRDPEAAFKYALLVDRAARPDTWQAAERDPQWAAQYRRALEGEFPAVFAERSDV